MTLLFLAAAAFCVYTWALFPLLAWHGARRMSPQRLPVEPDPLPSVSVIIAAHDEAERLPAKLASLDELDYPLDRLQVIIVSDGSGDGTEALLDDMATTRPWLLGLHYDGAAGKPTALNAGVARATGDVLVFMDARQSVSSNALKSLVAALSDPSVGAASGELLLSAEDGGDAPNVGLYWRYEKWLRENESRRFSTTGATGALYAVRRRDWTPHRGDELLDDFETPIALLRRGLRTVFVPEARVYDRAESDADGEFRRKSRTLAGNYQSFSRNGWLFDPRRNPVWWQFLSHKVFRLLVPYAMVTCFVTAMVGGNRFLDVMLVLQCVFYALGLAAFIGLKNRPSSFVRVFLQMNAAAVVGLVRWATGSAGVRWKAGGAAQRAAPYGDRPTDDMPEPS